MPRWYAPEDRWPRHSRGAIWREPLARARARGWLLKHSNSHAHIFGVLYCQDPAKNPGCHKFVVFSTAKGAEGAVTELLALLRTCLHSPPELVEVWARIEAELSNAEELIAAANHLVNQAELTATSESLFERAVELERASELADLASAATAEADALLREALDAEAAARAAGDQGRANVGEMAPADVVAAAGESLDAAERGIRRAADAVDVDAVQRRHGSAKADLERLQTRLQRLNAS